MSQTAIQELISAITQNGHIIINQTLIDTYLEKEKQQIIDAVVWFDETDRRPIEIEKEVEKYYNENFKSE